MPLLREAQMLIFYGFVPGYLRHGIFNREEVLPFIGQKKVFNGDEITLRGQRYQVFQQSLFCANCGIEGLYFAKEKCAYKVAHQIPGKGRHSYEWVVSPSTKHFANDWHLNLYAMREDGKEIMMTRDHIIPKAKGGPNTLENQETMCSKCNSNKKDKLPKTHGPGWRFTERGEKAEPLTWSLAETLKIPVE